MANGAYYPTRSYHEDSCCSCCCICKWFFGIILTLAIIIGIIALLVWIFIHPSPIKFAITHTSLTKFELSPSNKLSYHLVFQISIRNPNKKLTFKYDNLEAKLYYHKCKLDTIQLPSFDQGTKNTTHFGVVSEKQSDVIHEDYVIQQFNKEKGSGIYHIKVFLFPKISIELGSIKTPAFDRWVKCALEVPLRRHGAVWTPDGSENTECTIG